MGIKRFFKNKIKDYKFIKNKRKIAINHFDLDFFKNYQFNLNTNSHSPEVSIIIPVYNQIRYTLNCLYTIEQYDKNISKEIIIINDNSSDETLEFLSKIQGITIINNAENLGFLRNVNKGIQASKGKYIYLLNNDTEVQENYLSSLVDVFDTKENVGAVGSKMIFADNTLQEAGCLIFKGCEIVNLGRFNSIDHPSYNFLRKVDYCSGCSLLFKRLDTNGNLNLLDEEFLPAYYEETDFCQRLKYIQNLDIYYQPKSEILHFENISYTGKNSNKELLLEKNAKKFKERWNSKFEGDKFLDIDNRKHLNVYKNYQKPTILFLEESMPKYDQDSGSRRLDEIFKILIANNHKILLGIPAFNDTDKKYIEYCESLGIEVFQDFVTPKNKMVKINDQIIEKLPLIDLIWIFRPNGFKNWHKVLKNHITKQKLIYDMVDLHYLRVEREKEYMPVTPKMEKKNQKTKELEYAAMRNSDAVAAISDVEKGIVSQNGIDINKVHVVSNFHTVDQVNKNGFEDRNGLLFIGGFRHLPNIDALKFLVEDIMPLVWQKNDRIFVNVIGPELSEELTRKYSSEKVKILGYQETVDEWFESSRVFVAPLRYGAGVKGKIGQALEYELPIVTTPIGVEGMNLQNNVHALVSDINDAQAFANNILELYSNEDMWNTLKGNSKKALYPFSREVQGKNVLELISSLYLDKK
ncbi:MAG: glycosyltransferase [Chryseobacterium sp.]|uniref:glycosyltransferase n=1 Tax=Chryseobacterium sp. TaxID=1871047 RepID=UPI0025C0F71C|nr:glycosyltransferase [Chryseobacterium sp.]MCJ7933547.1 glycosyltransferase [Chryseobacterium sp.]